MPVTHPIDGQVVLLAGAKASVTLEQLSKLLERSQRHLVERRSTYEHGYERVHEDAETAYYLVESGHWEAFGRELQLDRREWAAVRRAHAEQLRWTGRRLERTEEFETALDIREAVVLSTSS